MAVQDLTVNSENRIMTEGYMLSALRKFNEQVEAGTALTPRMVADELDVTVKDVYYHINKGNLAVVKVGAGGEHLYYILRSTLDEYKTDRGIE